MQQQQHNQGNYMDLVKSQMMTMFMMKNMNGENSTSDRGIGNALYILIITQVVDFIIKYLPTMTSFVYVTFLSRYFEKCKTTIDKVVTENNIVKIKKSSITLTIRIGDQDNVIGQALMDFVTNCRNTTHVSYKNKNYMLNQTSVIEIHNDIYAFLTKSTDASSETTSSTASQMPTQLLEIYSFSKTVDELRSFLDDVKQSYVLAQKNKLGNAKCYFNMVPKHALKVMGSSGNQKKDYSRLPVNMSFTMKRFSTNRKFSNLFGEDINIIKNRVEFFVKNRKWYDEKGIPYSLGLLLSGKPGTGKTSTIKCLANETGRHIFNINLNNDITKQQLENLFFNEIVHIDGGEPFCIPLDQRIYVLEDIDCQSNIVRQRTDEQPVVSEESTYQIDLSFLLNLLDGVLEMPGRIVIMTSNFPDMLDSALVRPGRIDIIAKFTCCSYKTVVEMLEFFYDFSLSEKQRESIYMTDEYKITPAEMSRIMFENFSDIDNAIYKYLNYVSSKEKKEIGVVEELNTQDCDDPFVLSKEDNTVVLSEELFVLSDNPIAPSEESFVWDGDTDISRAKLTMEQAKLTMEQVKLMTEQMQSQIPLEVFSSGDTFLSSNTNKFTSLDEAYVIKPFIFDDRANTNIKIIEKTSLVDVWSDGFAIRE